MPLQLVGSAALAGTVAILELHRQASAAGMVAWVARSQLTTVPVATTDAEHSSSDVSRVQNNLLVLHAKFGLQVALKATDGLAGALTVATLQQKSQHSNSNGAVCGASSRALKEY